MAADVSDDLDFNPFLETVLSSGLFQKAVGEGCLICIPHSSSLKGLELDDKLIEDHILKSSPFLKNCYTTLWNGRGPRKQVSVSVEDCYVTCKVEGFKAEILHKEVGYAKNKSYTLYLLDRPLFRRFVPAFLNGGHLERPVGMLAKSFTEMESILKTSHGTKEVLPAVGNKLEQFLSSYMILPGYLEHASNKLKDLCTECTRLFEQSCHAVAPRFPVIAHLSILTECFLLGSMYDRLLPKLYSQYRPEDMEFCRKLVRMSSMDVTCFGGSDHHKEADMQPAVEILENLPKVSTPFEKMYCAKNLMDAIVECVNDCQPKGSSPVTSDELIPLVIFTVMRANVPGILAQMFYIDTFSWNMDKYDNSLSFAFATLNAAVQYLKTYKPETDDNLQIQKRLDFQETEYMQLGSHTPKGFKNLKKVSSMPALIPASRSQNQNTQSSIRTRKDAPLNKTAFSSSLKMSSKPSMTYDSKGSHNVPFTHSPQPVQNLVRGSSVQSMSDIPNPRNLSDPYLTKRQPVHKDPALAADNKRIDQLTNLLAFTSLSDDAGEPAPSKSKAGPGKKETMEKSQDSFFDSVWGDGYGKQSD